MAELKSTLHYTTYTHLRSYPVVDEVVTFATDWDTVKYIVKLVWSIIKTRLGWLTNYDFFVAYWNYFDTLFDSWLITLDARFPRVKEYSIVNSFASVQKSLNQRLVSINESVSPTVNRILASFDPVLKITNNYYENVLDTVLPVSDKAEAETAAAAAAETKTEYQRMIALFVETYNRIYLTTSSVTKIPAHVSNTYQNERKKENNTTFQAVSKTTRKLSNEAYQSIKPTLDRVVGSNESTNKIDIVAPPTVVDQVEPTVAINTTGVEVH